jgi:hypothetical protein
MKWTLITRNINFGKVGNGKLGSEGGASIPEKMSENGPVVAEILQFQVLPCLL